MIANANDGIDIDGAGGNTIGGTVSAAANVVSGNPGFGISLSGSGTNNNLVAGNRIGTDVSGTTALGNGSPGLNINLGAVNNTIGGTASGVRNLISGNQSSGVLISNAGTTGNVVEGDFIGTDATGTIAIGNMYQGVLIDGGATGNTIGGTTAGAMNLISGNSGDGVDIQNAGTSQNVIAGNLIGTDTSDGRAVGNSGAGLGISDSASGNTIGGTSSSAANVISGNEGDGVDIWNSGTSANVVADNVIGTSADGSIDLGNQGNGISIMDASGNTIGGESSGAGNAIGESGVQIGVAVVAGLAGGTVGTLADPPSNGIFVEGMASNNLIQGNYIGINKNGTPKGNSGNGVLIEGASNNTVGGTNIQARNYISANGANGVLITNEGASGNVLEGNYIGTDTTGMNAAPNATDGVRIANAASDNTVGGTVAGAANMIAFNGANGVTVGLNSSDDSTGDSIEGNSIFSNKALGIDLGDDGVTLVNSHAGTSGPNDWQNFPILAPANANDAILATLRGVPGTYRIEFFENTSPSPSGAEQGQSFLGFANLTIGSNSTYGSVSFTLPPNVSLDATFSATATAANGDTSEFDQTFSIAVIVPGFHLGGGMPSWEPTMDDDLTSEGYDDVIPFVWPSYSPVPGTVQTWATSLQNMILSVAGSSIAKNEDIDLRLITYSRGVGLGNLVLQNLAMSDPTQFANGAIDDTMLDPFPANQGSNIALEGLGSWNVNTGPIAHIVGDIIALGVTLFDDAAQDPNVPVPSNVTSAELYIQRTLANNIPSLTNPQDTSVFPDSFFNLWGQTPQSSGILLTPQPLTNEADHITMPCYYIMNYLAPQPTPQVVSPDESSGLDVIYPQYVNDATLAQALVNQLQAVETDQSAGDSDTMIAGLATFESMLATGSGTTIDPSFAAAFTSLAQLIASITEGSVADLPLSPIAVNETETVGTSFAGTVATFTEANPNAIAGQFWAQITWGDGSTSLGSIAPDNQGGFVVDGSHTYAGAGTFDVTVTINDAGGSTATAQSSIVVASPLVILTTVHADTNKKHQVTEIILTFSGPVNSSEANRTSLYRLAYPGKKGSYTAKNAQVIKLKSAVYNSADDTVALAPKKPFALTKKVQLEVDGVPPSGLQDSEGRYIDGEDNGMAGSNAIAILAKSGVTIDARTAERIGSSTTNHHGRNEAVVDAVLEPDAIGNLRRVRGA